MMASSRSCALCVRAMGNVSTALRREVNGFFNSWGHVGRETLDRLDAVVEGLRHVAQRAPERCPISSARPVKSGIS